LPYFLGIDGGGTKTRCVLGDEHSTLGFGSSTSCKIQRVGEACAHDALSAAIHEACVQAGTSPRQIARTCSGVTGAGRPEIADRMRTLISRIAGGEIEILGDAEIAFEDVFGAGPGIVVNAGTGSFAYGRNAKGEPRRAGGWGHSISDEGSGYWIGIEAIKAALQERDKKKESAFLNQLMEGLGAKDFDDFIVLVNANPAPDFGDLFPVVRSAADNDNGIANDVLDRAGQELANLATTIIQQLFGEATVSVAIHGGVLRSSHRVREEFAKHLRSQYPKVLIKDDTIDPARGALTRARRTFKKRQS
jgi:glucosamine kinase